MFDDCIWTICLIILKKLNNNKILVLPDGCGIIMARQQPEFFHFFTELPLLWHINTLVYS